MTERERPPPPYANFWICPCVLYDCHHNHHYFFLCRNPGAAGRVVSQRSAGVHKSRRRPRTRGPPSNVIPIGDVAKRRAAAGELQSLRRRQTSVAGRRSSRGDLLRPRPAVRRPSRHGQMRLHRSRQRCRHLPNRYRSRYRYRSTKHKTQCGNHIQRTEQ